jgi:hypothetical protein
MNSQTLVMISRFPGPVIASKKSDLRNFRVEITLVEPFYCISDDYPTNANFVGQTKFKFPNINVQALRSRT